MSSDESLAMKLDEIAERRENECFHGNGGPECCAATKDAIAIYTAATALRQPVLSVEGLKEKVEAMRAAPVPPTIATDDEFRDIYCQGYRHALSDVLAILAAPVETALGCEEEEIPHAFASRTRYEPGDDRDIWCNKCEYHRDHRIHIAAPVDARAPQEAPAIDRLAPLPWRVEELRPGHDDEARVYDNRCMGVFKPTCDNPHARRPIAEAIVAAVNGLRVPQLAEPTREAADRCECGHLRKQHGKVKSAVCYECECAAFDAGLARQFGLSKDWQSRNPDGALVDAEQCDRVLALLRYLGFDAPDGPMALPSSLIRQTWSVFRNALSALAFAKQREHAAKSDFGKWFDAANAAEAQVATLTTERDALRAQFTSVGYVPYLDRMREQAERIERLTAERDAALKLADSNLHPGRYPDPAFTIEGAAAGSRPSLEQQNLALKAALREIRVDRFDDMRLVMRIDAALAASEPAAKPAQAVWLIEGTHIPPANWATTGLPANGPFQPQWWTGRGSMWSPIAAEALRFARREDAERYMARERLPYSAVEHVFVAEPAAQPEKE